MTDRTGRKVFLVPSFLKPLRKLDSTLSMIAVSTVPLCMLPDLVQLVSCVRSRRAIGRQTIVDRWCWDHSSRNRMARHDHQLSKASICYHGSSTYHSQITSRPLCFISIKVPSSLFLLLPSFFISYTHKTDPCTMSSGISHNCDCCLL